MASGLAIAIATGRGDLRMNSNPESGTAVLVISLVISPVADGEGRSVMVWCSILLSLMAGWR